MSVAALYFNMKFKSLRLSAFLFVLFASYAYAEDNTNAWYEKTRTDLRKIQTIVQTDSSLALSSDKAFNAWLSAGLLAAEKLANKTAHYDKAHYLYSLLYYVAGFKEPHLFLEWNDMSGISVKYAGIKLRFDGKKYVVDAVIPKLVSADLLNAELLSCDGKSPENMITNDIMPFNNMVPIAATHYQLAGLIFFDANPYRTLPKTCRFQSQNKTMTQEIIWQQDSLSHQPDIFKQFRPILKTAEKKLEIKRIGKHGLLLQLPTFGIKEKFYQHLDRKGLSDHQINSIIIDLRDNYGGSDLRWQDLLKSLLNLSKNTIEKISTSGCEQYRVTKRNIQAMRQYGLTNIADKMQIALDNGQQYYQPPCQSSAKNSAQLIKEVEKNFGHRSLFLITDYHCVSSCLNFVEFMKKFSFVKLIGTPTNGDTEFGGVNLVNLDNGAQFGYPMTVISNHDRKRYETYAPDIEMSNQAELDKFIKTISTQ